MRYLLTTLVFMIYTFSIRASDEGYITLYKYANFGDKLVTLTHSLGRRMNCVNLDNGIQSNSQSYRSNNCFDVYKERNCRGEGFKFNPDGERNLGLYGYNDRIVSLRPCTIQESVVKSENEINFFLDPNFKGSSHGYREISISCTNLISHLQKTAQSITTQKCVDLFDKSGCSGNSYTVYAGKTSDLGWFRKQTVSFRPCDKASEFKYNIKFYSDTISKRDLQYEGDISLSTCYNKHSKFSARATSTSTCLKFYSGYGCRSSEQIFSVPAGTMTNFPTHIWDRILSFQSCSDYGNDYRYGAPCTACPTCKTCPSCPICPSCPSCPTCPTFKPKTVSCPTQNPKPRGYRLSINIIQIDVSTDRNDANARLMERMLAKEIYYNDAPLTKTFSYVENETLVDSVSATILQIKNATVSASLKINLTFFEASLNDTLKTHKLPAASLLRTEDDKMKNFHTEVEKVKKLVNLALTSAYNTTQRGSTYFLEESKVYIVNKTFQVLPCTKFEARTVVKTTKHFISYDILFDISGKYEDGSKMSAEDIEKILPERGIDFFQKKDTYTILAKSTAKMILNYNWGYVWSGNEENLEPCHSSDDSSILKHSITFYSNSYFKSVLFNTKLTGSCQVVPSKMQDNIVSVKTEACVILFPTEKCDIVDESNLNIGYALKVLPNEGRTLLYFENMTKSFQLCESYKGGSSKMGHVQFYSDTQTNEPLIEARLTTDCRDLPVFAKGNVSFAASNHCVTVYSGSHCLGKDFTVRPFSALKLKTHFDKMTSSFKACADIGPEDLQMQSLGSVKFFKDEDRTGLLQDSPIGRSCVNILRQIWGKISLVEADYCAILYEHPFCQGSSTFIQPRDAFKTSGSVIRSFVACDYDTS